MRLRLSLALVAAATPAISEIAPLPGSGDARLQSIDYNPGQVYLLHGAPGYQLTLELSPDEQVQNVAVGDSNSWQVSVNRRGDRLFVKPGQAPFASNMTVITNVRVYNFDLMPMPAPSSDMPYIVRFRYPEPRPFLGKGRQGEFVDVSAARQRASGYEVSGARVLRPSAISEDGQRTYVSWPKDRELPATYEVNDAGEEMLSNGMMRDDVLIIDRVVPRLVFRRDGLVAKARWMPRARKR